ncbi:hypothetical protein [Candidatus Electronema sp. JC]|uniref:hypothetical protein n=1 Tax=Candidatus Electronema sp. JC TaxID=3401570 RepID=UPI003B43C783
MINSIYFSGATRLVTHKSPLPSPDDPLPPLEECLHVRVHASQSLVENVRRDARTERLPLAQKLPLISSAQDTVLGLKDVLNPAGLLQLTGNDLFFDRSQPGAGECVIESTAGGRTVQTRFGKIEDSEIILMPDIPAQAHPWNNECSISVTTRYSEHGTLRTGTYARMLRTPLTLTKMGHPNPPEAGILTGKESSPHVSVTGGSVAADTILRIQAVLDMRQDALLFSLLDMTEGGKTGAAVSVTANGAVTLQGFADSAVSSLSIRVNAYAELKEMIRSKYGGRLVDVLKVETA